MRAAYMTNYKATETTSPMVMDGPGQPGTSEEPDLRLHLSIAHFIPSMIHFIPSMIHRTLCI